MESKIHQIRVVTSTKWRNGKYGHFIYDEVHRNYRLYELTPDLKSFLVPPTGINLDNCPVVANGIIAYLIRNWGKKELEIFEGYNDICSAEYNKRESVKPGAFKRNIDEEFYSVQLVNEEKSISFSEKLYDFLPAGDIEMIKQYVDSYFDYLKEKIKPTTSLQINKEHESPDQNIIQKITVIDKHAKAVIPSVLFPSDYSKLSRIYAMSSDIFEDDEKIFINCVFAGDLSTIKIKDGSKTRLKHLIYKLSRYMGDGWYSAVCTSLQLKKTDCSKPYDETSHKFWGDKIEKEIPQDTFAIISKSNTR